MPLTEKGKKVLSAMSETYSKKGKTAKEIKSIFYATLNKDKKRHGKERGFAQLHEDD